MTVIIRHGEVLRGRKVVLHAGELGLPAEGNVGVIGANGAGKTTLFMALADVLTSRAGTLEVVAPWEAARIAYAPQQPAFPRWLTVSSAVALYDCSIDGLTGQLPDLRLAELADMRIAQLSGGQVQVLALAVALGRRAPLSILDEPLANLDLPRRRAALRAIAGHRVGLTLVSAQSAADVIDCCDWYIVLRDGRYVFNGPVDDLLGTGWREDSAKHSRLEQRLLDLMGFGSHT